MDARKEHWNRIYATTPVERLGWYEAVPEPSLRLLQACTLEKDDCVLDVGAGASTFIDHLLAAGFRHVVAADISEEALQRLQERLGAPRAAQVRWIVDDVTAPAGLGSVHEVALWHDRALFHFFTTEPQRQAYRKTLRELLRPRGYVIMATFARGGAQRCSGLDVYNHDAPMLATFLGAEFQLLSSFDYLYHMPSGDGRPYTYALFRRRSSWGPGLLTCPDFPATIHPQPGSFVPAHPRAKW